MSELGQTYFSKSAESNKSRVYSLNFANAFEELGTFVPNRWPEKEKKNLV